MDKQDGNVSRDEIKNGKIYVQNDSGYKNDSLFHILNVVLSRIKDLVEKGSCRVCFVHLLQSY